MDEALLLRQIPHSVEAEQAVLGSILIDPKCVPEVVETLNVSDFYVKVNQEIYETIYQMFLFGETIDIIPVLDRMKRGGVYDPDTTQRYLFQLMEITPTAANFREYMKIVREKSLLRQVYETAGELTALVQQGSENAYDVLELAEQRIYAIRQDRDTRGLDPLSTILPKLMKHLQELSMQGSDVPGMATGFSELDQVLTGFHPSELILIAARPGMGKTSFALNILLNAGKFSGKAVAFFSLEMSQEQLGSRLLASETFLDNRKLLTGKLTPDDWSKLVRAYNALLGTQIYIDDNPALSVADMKAKCRRLKNLGLVVIDYLQLMQSSGSGVRYAGENRQQVVADISRSLKIMAKELQVPVLCLSQLSRANESRSDKRPMLSDLRESGAIEQDADVVMFLYREDYYDKESEKHNLAECIIAKNRRGETRTVNLRWMPEFTSFSTLDHIYDDPEE